MSHLRRSAVPASEVRMLRILPLLILLAPAGLAAQRPIPGSTVVSGTLSYDGRATLGNFTGSTDSVAGRLVGASDLAHVTGFVEARAATLKTGNGKRDRDQYKSLEVDSFPTIRYELDSVSVDAPGRDSTTITLRGHFVIHGVRRAADLPARLVLTATTGHVTASTPLDLRHYGIEGLSKLLGVLKMDPNIVVRIDVTFTFPSPVTPP
jgi:polyisoprenoid-binding protein YceI